MDKDINKISKPPATCNDAVDMPKNLIICSPKSAQVLITATTVKAAVRIAHCFYAGVKSCVRLMNIGNTPKGLTKAISAIKILNASIISSWN